MALTEAAKMTGVSDVVWTVSAITRRTFGLTIACVRVKPRREARLEAAVPSETRVELLVCEAAFSCLRASGCRDVTVTMGTADDYAV
jgi:hypothetical protein